MESLAGLAVLAYLVESFTEYVFAPFEVLKPYLRFIPLALAVVAAIAFQVDATAVMGLTPPHPLVGQVLTGLVLGRGSSFVHDFLGGVVTRLKGTAP